MQWMWNKLTSRIVRIEYKNKNLEVVNSKEFGFEEYCDVLSRKILGVLYKVESYTNEDISFHELKNYIFNVAGSVKRIPENIKGE